MWEKPMLVIVNAADDDENLERFDRTAADGQPRMIAARVGLERELARMSDADRAEFEQEMGPGGAHRDDLLRAILDASGQMLYFTAGEKEVRTWMLRQGGTALEAADNVHSDLARGFIRAEVMQVDDLVRLGGEREVKAANLVRQEPKNYVIRDGDILHIRSGI
jgi:ribosome-binding ATPase